MQNLRHGPPVEVPTHVGPVDLAHAAPCRRAEDRQAGAGHAQRVVRIQLMRPVEVVDAPLLQRRLLVQAHQRVALAVVVLQHSRVLRIRPAQGWGENGGVGHRFWLSKWVGRTKAARSGENASVPRAATGQSFCAWVATWNRPRATKRSSDQWPGSRAYRTAEDADRAPSGRSS